MQHTARIAPSDSSIKARCQAPNHSTEKIGNCTFPKQCTSQTHLHEGVWHGFLSLGGVQIPRRHRQPVYDRLVQYWHCQVDQAQADHAQHAQHGAQLQLTRG